MLAGGTLVFYVMLQAQGSIEALVCTGVWRLQAVSGSLGVIGCTARTVTQMCDTPCTFHLSVTYPVSCPSAPDILLQAHSSDLFFPASCHDMRS